VLAVLWGRSVFNNIRKFLQFQLTINIVALVIAFIGAFVSKEPLNVLQLLWVNLIMDTLAALALATENPHVSLLNHKPHGRAAPLINKTMWKHMIVQVCARRR
jgi:P-type Ca2+ transporter type 2C